MKVPKTRILCTEDNPDTRDLLVLILGEEGFDVVCAEGSEEALRLAKTEVFDLFLIDSWLPGLPGVELCKELRKFAPTTPVLFYSAAAYAQDKENARLAGAQGYLVKPAGCDELVSAVNRVISESKPSQTPRSSGSLSYAVSNAG